MVINTACKCKDTWNMLVHVVSIGLVGCKQVTHLARLYLAVIVNNDRRASNAISSLLDIPRGPGNHHEVSSTNLNCCLLDLCIPPPENMTFEWNAMIISWYPIIQ